MMKNLIAKAKFKIGMMLANQTAASLWEYLLVIAIVCIIGAALIGIISGENGINSLWTNLFNRFSTILGTANAPRNGV